MARTSSGGRPDPATSNHDRGHGSPSGLSRIGWLTSGPGRKASEVTPSPRARTPSAATGHQRRDGSRPSGNHSTPNVSRGLNPHIQTHDDTHATATAPGMDPGRSTRPRWAYEYAASVTCLLYTSPSPRDS